MKILIEIIPLLNLLTCFSFELVMFFVGVYNNGPGCSVIQCSAHGFLVDFLHCVKPIICISADSCKTSYLYLHKLRGYCNYLI